MLNDQQFTGAPRTVTIAGKEFRACPLTDSDIAELDAWVQERFLDTAYRANTSERLSEADKDRNIRLAQMTAVSLSAFSGVGAKTLATIDGITQVFWVSIRKHHPEETPSTIRKLIYSLRNVKSQQEAMRRMNETFAKNNNVEDKLNSGKGAEKKGGARRKRRK